MKNVFLSRPSWIAQEFQQGLEAFVNILETYDMNPITLGVNKYPVDAPLEEVISIMDQCVGAIILGYPQIEISQGLLKGLKLESSVMLATEWNHIEAGLAYAKGLPLLVIHHRGVQRGIFDRGAIGKFLYEVDLSNATWFSEKRITGAICTWKERLNKASAQECYQQHQHDDLKFDRRLGIFISTKTRSNYCSRCFHSTPSREVELQTHSHGWSCPSCGAFYSNPDYVPPKRCDDWTSLGIG